MRRVTPPVVCVALLLLHAICTAHAAPATSPDGNVTNSSANASSVSSTSSTSEKEGALQQAAEADAANLTTGCDACCGGGGDCSAAFRGTPGTCCGVIGSKPFCCPTTSSSFGAAVRALLLFVFEVWCTKSFEGDF
jgi:hypothetical protein